MALLQCVAMKLEVFFMASVTRRRCLNRFMPRTARQIDSTQSTF